MRLSTLILLAVGTAAFAIIGCVFWRAISETREWNGLLALSGKDSAGLISEESSRREALARRFLPGGGAPGFALWRVLTLDGPDSTRRVVLVWTQESRAVPGPCPVRIDVLDQGRRHLSSTAMESGARFGPIAVKPLAKPESGSWTFTVVTDQGVQHYALVEETPVLIRLEHNSGAIAQNYYDDSRELTIGPAPPVRSPEGWESALSEGPAETLRTLMWLGGAHDSPNRTLNRPGVVRKVAELRKSPHPWIAEAARAVQFAEK